MITYNKIKKVLSDIATNHLQINSFGFGAPPKFGAGPTLDYPVMWVAPHTTGSQIVGNELNLKFSIIFADLVHPDDTNLDEVHSDTLSMATDVKALLNNPANDDLFTIEENSPLEQFIERFDDSVAGWTLDIDFKINYTGNRCIIPTA